MEPAVEIRELGKRYRLGLSSDRLSERLNGLLTAPFRRTRSAGAGALDTDAGQEDFWALRSVSARVEQGEVVGLIGDNGAGKSTLLKILSRITPPTEGEVVLRGRLASLLEVGTGFNPELTGRENVFLNGAILGMREHEVESRFDEIAEFSGVDQFLDTPVKRYSSGMFVRLAFAVAAHLEPEILIVDEVLAVGDVQFQRKCTDKLRETSRRGGTIIFVSHNMAAVKRLCDRAYWLERGGIHMEGPAQEVVDSYLAHSVGLASEGYIQFERPEQRFGTGEARFLSAGLRSGEASYSGSIAIGDPITIEAEIEVNEPVPEVAIELGISAADGERVITTQNIDGGSPATPLEPGRHAMRATVDARLLPGEFVLDLALHRLSGHTIDFAERALEFTVVNASDQRPNDFYPWPVVRGYVRAPALWSMDAHRPLVDLE